MALAQKSGYNLKPEHLYKAMAVRNLLTSHMLHTALRTSADSGMFGPERNGAFKQAPPLDIRAKNKYSKSSQSQSHSSFSSNAANACESTRSNSVANSIISIEVKCHLLHKLVQQESSTREALVVQEAEVVQQLQGMQAGRDREADPAAGIMESTRAAQAEALADCGAEMDPLSTELDLEVKGLRQDLLNSVEEYAKFAARLEEAGAAHAHAEPAASSGVDRSQESKQLQARWQQLAYENMHLQVRIAQLRQLPGQPKRKITMAAVKEQQSHDLYYRRSLLIQRTSEMAARLCGM